MKTPLLPAIARALALHSLPAFLWVEQEPEPVWSAAQASGTSRVQAIGTATEVGGDKFVAWSSTAALRMGGATATATDDDRRIVVHTT